uniref:Cobalt-precorrin-5B C(1)-methyltransferase n=1 Tax=Fundidesulfovibrio putealis TaxID=270496 RepID=A0A7C3W805_9BACT
MSARQRDKAALRQGFTTGSAAAAAAVAALELLLRDVALDAADIPLPPGGRLAVPVARVEREGGGVRARVVKDAGDDPDATHGALIECLAERAPGPPGQVELLAGRGVGRVTLPGLPVAPGQPAINPAPRAQIVAAAREAAARAGYAGALRLLIEVPDGEALARRTLNPRLGIVGGISILGTQGVVKPFSHAAWLATIDAGLDVARAAGQATAALSTGRRSERLLMARLPELPALCFVQAADHFGHGTRRAASGGFTTIVWGCFFGKLAKMAQGLESTHAHAAALDFALLTRLAREAGVDAQTARGMARANTARHALDLAGDKRQDFARIVTRAALDAARTFAGPGPRLGVCCFDFDETLLAEAYSA